VLRDLTVGFEPLIAEIFDPDKYPQALDQSRAAVRDDEGQTPGPS
jgi:hypothetical protein